ncbi:MAG: hypothetical protein WCI97_00535 [Bacteroidota bacterium]
MKNYLSLKKVSILFFIFSFSFLVSFAQLPIDNKLIPETVKKHFAERFPTVGAVVWTQPSPGFLETTFPLDKHSVTVMYAMAMGDWISTDTKLKAEEFPAAATSYLASNISGGKITGYYKSETKKGIEYYSEVKNAGKLFTYSFDADGNFVSKVEEE